MCNHFFFRVKAIKDKLCKHLLITMVLLTIMILSSILTYWNLTSRYFEIYIPIASYHKDIWDSESRGNFSYIEDKYNYYILRYTGTSYYDVNKWSKFSEITHYFDEIMSEKGWERASIFMQGDNAVPETEFLSFGDTKEDQGYIVYVQKDDEQGKKGRAVLAVSRIVSNDSEDCSCSVNGFHITFTTVKPSILTSFKISLD